MDSYGLTYFPSFNVISDQDQNVPSNHMLNTL